MRANLKVSSWVLAVVQPLCRRSRAFTPQGKLSAALPPLPLPNALLSSDISFVVRPIICFLYYFSSDIVHVPVIPSYCLARIRTAS